MQRVVPTVLRSMLMTCSFVLCTGCDSQRAAESQHGDTDVCRTIIAGVALPIEVRETSGIAVSAHGTDVLWTHNDRGNDPILYSVSADGRLLNRVAVPGAVLEDWEDIEAGSCDAGRCLYIADIGDNTGTRESITIYEVVEPAPDAESTLPARPLHARYPDGPHNAEALFMLPSGDLFIVTKGDDGPLMLYRYPAAMAETNPGAGALAGGGSGAAGDTVTLEKVREGHTPEGRGDLVTGAAASPDGRWVAVRTYSTLYFYPADSFVSGDDVVPVTVDLRPLGEGQGEGVAIEADGTVWLTSEAASRRALPRLARLSCTLPELPTPAP